MNYAVQRLLTLVFALFLCMLTADFSEAAQYTQRSAITPEVEKNISAVLKSRGQTDACPEPKALKHLLDFMLINDGSTRRSQPEKRDQGQGIYWRSTIPYSFDVTLRYLYNPNISSELLYPSSIRSGGWKNGGGLKALETPLWELAGKIEEPLIVRGKEREVITPDDFSGSYYVYDMDRMIVLMKYNGKPVLMSVSWQSDKSEVGRKGGFIGPYSNWDFVYTDVEGATASGIGWMSTYMYSSCAITVLFPTDDGKTGYSMFKWLRAGWSGMNVVERNHIRSGAERTFSGVMEVLKSERNITPEVLEKLEAKVAGMSTKALVAAAAPYCAALAEASKNDEVLSTEDFQKVLAGGGYAAQLKRDELESLVKSIELKRLLGKPVLGDK